MNPATYYRALASEILAVKDRVATLIDESHQGEIGSWRESILRSLLRRHLPSTMGVGQGFILTDDGPTTQCDIIVYDLSYPKLVQEGDLVVVTPDAVRAVIEVKSSTCNDKLRGDLQKLAYVAFKCRRNPEVRLAQRENGSNGLFVGYLAFGQSEGKPLDFTGVNRALRNSIIQQPIPLKVKSEELSRDEEEARILRCTQRHTLILRPWQPVINAVCLGPDLFARYWEQGEETMHADDQQCWKYYELRGLAYGYFITNLLAAVSPGSIDLNHQKRWPHDGKGDGRRIDFPLETDFDPNWSPIRLVEPRSRGRRTPDHPA